MVDRIVMQCARHDNDSNSITSNDKYIINEVNGLLG